MNLRGELDQKWKITMLLLGDARALLCKYDIVEKFIVEYDEYIEHNEFEVALDTLEEAALTIDDGSISHIWVKLKMAAKSMNLEGRYAFYDQKIAFK